MSSGVGPRSSVRISRTLDTRTGRSGRNERLPVCVSLPLIAYVEAPHGSRRRHRRDTPFRSNRVESTSKSARQGRVPRPAHPESPGADGPHHPRVPLLTHGCPSSPTGAPPRPRVPQEETHSGRWSVRRIRTGGRPPTPQTGTSPGTPGRDLPTPQVGTSPGTPDRDLPRHPRQGSPLAPQVGVTLGTSGSSTTPRRERPTGTCPLRTQGDLWETRLPGGWYEG